jgi:hypothetical protein
VPQCSGALLLLLLLLLLLQCRTASACSYQKHTLKTPAS